MENLFNELFNDQKINPNNENVKKLFETLNTMPLYIMYNKDGHLLIGRSENNEDFIPTVTSLEKCKKMNAHQYKEINFVDLKQEVLMPNSSIIGIVINPLDENMLMKKEDIFFMDQLLTGMKLERTTGTSQTLDIKPPKSTSEVLKRELTKFASIHKNIEQINLYEIRRNNNDSYHQAFFVKFNGRDVDLFPALAEKVRFFIKPGDKFELIKWDREISELPFSEETILFKKL